MASRWPEPGDYGLAPGGSWPMWLVRLGTFSRYGHAAICESVEVNQVSPYEPDIITIIEPMPGGCRRRAARPDEFTWSDLTLSDTQREQIVTAARRTIGLPYDWWAIACFVGRVWRSRLLRVNPARPGDDKLICSELVAWAYRQASPPVDLAPGKSPGDVSPGDLADVLVKGLPG
jgi:hypothetical protein